MVWMIIAIIELLVIVGAIYLNFRTINSFRKVIKNADLILVMKDGAVLEQGNFGELMAKNGAFADLYRSQLA